MKSESDAVTEALRNGDTGCRAEKCRYRVMRGVAQAQVVTGDPTTIQNSPPVSYSSADLELDKSMCNKERTIGANIAKRHHAQYVWCCRLMKEEKRCKRELEKTLKRSQLDPKMKKKKPL